MRNMLLFAAIVSAFTAAPANAVILAYGSNPLIGTTVASEPQLARTVVEDEINAVTFAIGDGVFSGSVQSRVSLSIDGTYDFDWRIFDTSFTGTDGSRLGSFGLIAIDNPLGLNANYRNDGLGAIGPDIASVPDPLTQAIFGGGLTFSFSNGLAAGEDSKFFFLDTTATNYSKMALFSLSGFGRSAAGSPSFATFAPAATAAVPEPASWAMMISGFAVIGASMRRRKMRLAFGQFHPVDR